MRILQVGNVAPIRRGCCLLSLTAEKLAQQCLLADSLGTKSKKIVAFALNSNAKLDRRNSPILANDFTNFCGI
jgi:hypothetical protein